MFRRRITWVLLLADTLIVSLSPYLALLIRFDGSLDSHYLAAIQQFGAILLPCSLVSMYIFGLYQRLWRYAGIDELLSITGAVLAATLIAAVIMLNIGLMMPRSIYFLVAILNLLLIGISRLALRLVQQVRASQHNEQRRTLIYGAGDSGAMIARELLQRYRDTRTLVGFVDDDHEKKDLRLFNARVLGAAADLPRVLTEQRIDEVLISDSKLDGRQLKDVVRTCRMLDCIVKTVPGINESLDSKVSLQKLRDIELEDLLRRDPIKLDLHEIVAKLKGKRVLVTGAGGSIGSEICRQVASHEPECLVLLGKGENSIYEIHQELKVRYPQLKLEPVIADINQSSYLRKIFQQVMPQIVFHAAAHKHVPLMEAQPEQAVRNNIFGTYNVAKVAQDFSVERFVLLSTDKAVNPTSIMGATKRMAELLLQQLGKNGTTQFMAVRFGNVLGSRGSVVPLFKRQIAAGGPITITHPEMKRYFMTIPEAVQLVLEAVSIAKGGEVFVFDMGEPVKILDMACELIYLSGLVPYKDIAIEFTGMRPGEKLFEELLTAEEGTRSTKHEKIFIANIKQMDVEHFKNIIGELDIAEDGAAIVSLLKEAIHTYQPMGYGWPAQRSSEKIAKEA